jgi:hypothetical protein
VGIVVFAAYHIQTVLESSYVYPVVPNSEEYSTGQQDYDKEWKGNSLLFGLTFRIKDYFAVFISFFDFYQPKAQVKE